MNQTQAAPRAFFWRRIHSITGLFIVLFLIEHLLTNSQAALFLGDDGQGFVEAVNGIKNLPYLPVIEITLIGLPLLLHGAWGIRYLWTSKINSLPTDGTRPHMTYPRNRAYTWQRITSWILLFFIAGHVIQMRFWQYPASAKVDDATYYMVRVELDPGIYTVADRLDVQLYDQRKIDLTKKMTVSVPEREGVESRLMQQKKKQHEAFVEALEQRPLVPGQAVAVAGNFGTAELFLVRETFKSPVLIAIYSIFVLSASFHAFNGLWTFLITWGVSLTPRSQILMRRLSVFLMVLIACLGLAAIWLTYWVNLKQ